MIKIILSAMIVLLALFSGATAEEPSTLDKPVKTVRIVSVKPAADGIYAMAAIEYPKSWGDDIKFTVEVNGRPTRINVSVKALRMGKVSKPVRREYKRPVSEAAPAAQA